ncbi:MAG: TetR/AcrR family transcriptional regulator, partial [Oscillospiraceae bacterium]|nr:TetR/AcrR family transcriptional regulator [Oscillospiraceae bacterium]
MDTKKRILDEALTLFAEKGYANVFVADIAGAVGIKAPSLYKHYKSKQDIFDAILAEMKRNYDRQSSMLEMNGNDASADAAFFSGVTEDQLVKTGMGLFMYFLHDDYARRFRKMLTVEQFRSAELASLFTRQYADDPLSYQSAMFALLSANGVLKAEDPDVMALQFYAPMFMLMTVCDRHPEREPELISLAERHIRQFS